MIRYDLKCRKGHGFASWFASGDAFDGLKSAARIACPVCGTTDVSKALMAPGVAVSREAIPVLSEPTDARAKALAALRRRVEQNSDYVGAAFAREARAIHAGEVPERSIYGEARPDEARALIEEGVPLLPLPFRPKRNLQ